MKPDDLNFRHLLYFWAVAKEGSITRAAERLGLLGVAGPVPQTLADAQQKMADNAT